MIRVAFILLVHQNPDQIIRLVNKLDSPHTDLYIHIDSRAGKTFILKLKEKLENKKMCISLKIINVIGEILV